MVRLEPPDVCTFSSHRDLIEVMAAAMPNMAEASTASIRSSQHSREEWHGTPFWLRGIAYRGLGEFRSWRARSAQITTIQRDSGVWSAETVASTLVGRDVSGCWQPSIKSSRGGGPDSWEESWELHVRSTRTDMEDHSMDQFPYGRVGRALVLRNIEHML